MTEIKQSEQSTESKQPGNGLPPSESTKPTAAGEKARVKPPIYSLGWGVKLVLVLALLFALAAAAVSGYVFYLQQQKHIAQLEERQSLLAELQSSSNQGATLKLELESLAQRVAQDRKAIQRANEERGVLLSRMATLEQEISKVTGNHRIDWMLREVEHFITVAERRLSLLGDARGALALMIEAEDIVRAMREPTARPLREAIVTDIHTLKVATETQIDVDGLFVRIGELIKRVDKLGIPSYELFQNPPSKQRERAGVKDDFDFFMERFGLFLDSLVRYEKHEKSKPILLTSQRDYLIQSVELLLNQAQLALLKGDNQAYHLSLQEAKNRVELYVQQQNQEAKFFISEIGHLASIQIRPKVPTIEASNRAVRVFRDFWDKEKLIRQQQVMELQRESE